MHSDQKLADVSKRGNLEEIKPLLLHQTQSGRKYKRELSFFISCEHGNLEVVKYLLDVGVDIHISDNYGLRVASENGHLEVVKLLIEHGADVNAYSGNCLYYSSYGGHLEVVKFLLDNGAKTHIDGAMHGAIKADRLTIIEILLDHGANVSKLFETFESFGGNYNQKTYNFVINLLMLRKIKSL
jgi:ankyrin repeat protein